jgi:hypothetical protein
VGMGPNPQSPIPNPQSPIPIIPKLNNILIFLSYKKYYKIYKLIFGKKYNRNKEKNIYIQINIIS